jgi:hypothetical protein
MADKKQKVKGGSKKIGRSKRSKDSALSAYVRGVISFATYAKRKGIKYKVA